MDFFFVKNLDRNLSKIISKSLSSKYSQKLLDHVRQSATEALKLLQKG